MGLDTVIELRKRSLSDDNTSYYPSRKFTNLLVDLATQNECSVLHKVCQVLDVDLKSVVKINTYHIYDQIISGDDPELVEINEFWIELKFLIAFFEDFTQKVLGNSTRIRKAVVSEYGDEISSFFKEYDKGYDWFESSSNLICEMQGVIRHFEKFSNNEQVRIWYF